MAFAVIAALAITPQVGAVFMPSYDLSGLVFRSKAVVIAERLEPGGGSMRFRVKKAYLGSLLPGEEIRVDIGAYDLKGGGVVGEQLKTIDAENILFLEETKPPSLVLSGIKVLSAGKVYGFEQMSNPGGYSLYPERQRRSDGADEEDLSLDRVEAITLVMHEGELRREIARVEAFRAVLEIKDVKLKERELLELLGPPAPRPVLLRDYERRELDDLQVRVLKTLHETSDFRLTLEGLARTRPFRLPFLPEEIFDTTNVSQLLPAATSRDLPLDLREAATLALRSCWWNTHEATLQAAMRSLLQDPSPEIRRAALVNLAYVLHNLNNREEHPEALEAILAAGRVEEEPLTRLLFLEVAGRLEISELPRALSGSGPITLLAGFHDKRAYAAWAFTGKPAGDLIEALFTAIAVPRGGGVERRTRPVKDPDPYRDCGSLRLALDPPLDAGEYELRVEGRFRFKEKPDVTAASPPVAVTITAAAAATLPHEATQR